MNGTKQCERLGHVPALDGIRAIAVVLVLAFHANLPGFRGGRAGVDVFFVLSGFLITSLLLVEHDRRGKIDLRAFWMRRALRLYPALIVAIAGALFLAWLKMPVFGATNRSLLETLKAVPFTLFYTMNIPRAAGWSGGGMLGHAWSLAIEEQFYLIWPVVAVALLNRRRSAVRMAQIAVAGAVVSASLRAGMDAAGVRSELLYNATFSHIDGVLAGCALAVGWAMYRGTVRKFGHPILPPVIAIVGTLIIIRGKDMNTYGFAVIVMLTILLIIDVLARPESLTARALSHPAPVAIGRRSYGLYIYHWPIFVFIGMDDRLLDAALGIAAAFVVAWFSFAVIEQPFLRMKARWATSTERVTLSETM
ncbi:MAG: acyltransferase [Acidimicrobiaceae bacterium]|nr:acyltransferase [Acidimicrobiaceae bacterium]